MPPKKNPLLQGNCVAGFTAAGAGVGVEIGGLVGGGVGAVGGAGLGAGGGTLVAPVVGTIGAGLAGGVAGEVAGAAGGALVGGGLGAGAGYLLGNIVCNRSGNDGDYRDKTRGANANDKQQIRNVAREEGVDANRFGKWLEMEKRAEGRGASDNYTYGELKQLAQTYRAQGGR
jgi:hypothetical protein